MKLRGINYDVGTKTVTGGLTRKVFDVDIVTMELTIIKKELHCNAVRISGVDTDRIVKASEIALNIGLKVWFSPSLHNESQENTHKYIISNSVSAEKLRKRYPDLIFVVGCELSIFTKGFVKGKTGNERLKNLFSPAKLILSALGLKHNYDKNLNSFLRNTVSEVRKRFFGGITYASGPWEKVDWNLFDIAGFDYYRSSYNKASYSKDLQLFSKLKIPVSITESGCCTFKGAENKGAMGWTIVDWSKQKPELKGKYTRDEDAQARTISELLKLYEEFGIYAAFVFTFVSYNYVSSEIAKYDLDLASFGIVKVLQPGSKHKYKGLPWLPKRAFFSLAECYRPSRVTI